jgi:hypothetical protein
MSLADIQSKSEQFKLPAKIFACDSLAVKRQRKKR